MAEVTVMKMRQAKELSWDDLRWEAERGSLFVLSVAPLEDHASHLPSGTDPLICEAMVQGAIVEMEAVLGTGYDAGEISAIVLPTWYQGASALRSLGCLRLTPRTLVAALWNYGQGLAELGVRRLALLTSHGADSHLDALDQAAAKLSRATRMRVLSPSSQLLRGFLHGDHDERVQEKLGRPYTDAEREGLRGDVHAGGWETSIMAYLHPELVALTYAHLPPHPVPQSMRARLKALKAHRGYFGSPHVASPELGQAAFQVMTECAARMLEEFCRVPVRDQAPTRPMTSHGPAGRKGSNGELSKVIAGIVMGVFLFWWWERRS